MKIYPPFYVFLFGMCTSCHIPYTGTLSQTSYYEPGTSGFIASDSMIIQDIFPFREEMNKEMNEVLASSESIMEKGKPESKLGNFVADVCMSVASKHYNVNPGSEIDFCMLNNGGLRSSLPAGEITRKNVYELMPFENELVVLTLNGSTVSKLLSHIAGTGGVPVSGLRMKITGDIYSDVYIGGKLFDSTATYKLVTSDYLANGGDALNMLRESLLVEHLNIKVREAIMDAMIAANNNRQTVKAELDERISK